MTEEAIHSEGDCGGSHTPFVVSDDRSGFVDIAEPEPADIQVDEALIAEHDSIPRRGLKRTAFTSALLGSLTIHAAVIGTLVCVVARSPYAPPRVLNEAKTSGGIFASQERQTKGTSGPLPSIPRYKQPILVKQAGVQSTEDDRFAPTPVQSAAQAFAEATRPNTPIAKPKETAFALPQVASVEPLTASSRLVQAKPSSRPSSVNVPPTIAAHRGSGGTQAAAKIGYDERGLAKPDYPRECQQHRQQGLVLLDVEILSDGKPGKITVIQDPGFPLLVDAAVEAVRESAFEAAKVNGVPATGHLQIPYRFVLTR